MSKIVLLLISLQTDSTITGFPVFAVVWQKEKSLFVSICIEYGSVNVSDMVGDRLHLRNSFEQQ